jgi:hypothetical protein
MLPLPPTRPVGMLPLSRRCAGPGILSLSSRRASREKLPLSRRRAQLGDVVVVVPAHWSGMFAVSPMRSPWDVVVAVDSLAQPGWVAVVPTRTCCACLPCAGFRPCCATRCRACGSGRCACTWPGPGGTSAPKERRRRSGRSATRRGRAGFPAVCGWCPGLPGGHGGAFRGPDVRHAGGYARVVPCWWGGLARSGQCDVGSTRRRAAASAGRPGFLVDLELPLAWSGVCGLA